MFLRGEVGQDRNDPATRGSEGVGGRKGRAVHVQLAAIDGTEGGLAPEALLAEHRVLPGLQRREALGGERLVDLVVVEVLEGEPGPGERPGCGVGRCHQEAPAPTAATN